MMIQQMKKKMKMLCSITVILFLFMASASTVSAKTDVQGHQTLKVAFPQVKGLTETDQNGKRHGLVVDYLNEIAKYTGWEYQYIDVPVDELMEEFSEGKFDLMGGTYYIPGLEEEYAYPDYNMGYSKAVLLGNKCDNSIRRYDLNSIQGKTIGVYERATENIRRLQEFLDINNLDCTLKYYDFEQHKGQKNLYAYLKNGEVDLLLGNGFESDDDLYPVVTFDSQPYYIVTAIGNLDILDGLNMALKKIIDSDGDFAAKCYEANFPEGEEKNISFTEEEEAFIRQKGSVTVALQRDVHPLSCKKTEDTHSGITTDFMEEISGFSGLQFTCIYTDTYKEAVTMVRQGDADVLGFYLGNDQNSQEQGLSLSTPYVNLNSILVRNKKSTYPSEGLIGAVIDGRELPEGIQTSQVRYFSQMEDGLKAVDSGEVDFIFGLSARLERDMQRYHYSNLLPVTLVNDRNDICFAVPRPAETELLTILNKSINSISAERKAEIMDQNMVSIGTSRLSLKEFIYSNPAFFIGTLLVLFLIFIVTALLIIRSRLKAAEIQIELEKAETQNRSKGEFLSKMSHEIRTPMNAIMGLADLTCRIENIPENIQDNLKKIHSSSRYLLNLLNDILDMSRIDNGKLDLCREPFSLKQLLDRIEDMLGGEAQRRGIIYTIEKEMPHSAVSGDSVRLQQVLTNLISNAFKFTPHGGTVVLRVTETACDNSNVTCRFEVTDNGIGIPKEDQQRIFESFEQLGANSSKSQGTGLGLPISYSIVKAMGGELKVDSRPERGSTFYFTVSFPLTGELDETSKEQKLYVTDDFLNHVNILLAEDNELNADIATELLEIKGAKVLRCEDGQQTYECFTQSVPGQFSIILMDIQMPRMNGLETARAIRALNRQDAVTIPIVAMTANTFKEDVDAAMNAGMDYFVSKPLNIESLYRILYEIIKGKEVDN